MDTRTWRRVDLGDHCSSGLGGGGRNVRGRRNGRWDRGHAPAGPRPEEGQADFARVVQIRVEPNRAAARRAEVHQRRLVRVLEREEAVELEQAACVRRALGAGDHDFASRWSFKNERPGKGKKKTNKRGRESVTYMASFRTSSTRTHTPGGRLVAITASSLIR